MDLADGTEVILNIPEAPSGLPAISFAQRYAEYIGDADDLPPDLSEKLDHYLHGRVNP